MSGSKTLVRNVYGSDGVLYGPDGVQDVPSSIAEEFDNPKLYEEAEKVTILTGLAGSSDPDHPGDEPGAGATGGELKGKALTDALEAASLDTSGTVAEKRERLAAYQAGTGPAV